MKSPLVSYAHMDYQLSHHSDTLENAVQLCVWVQQGDGPPSTSGCLPRIAASTWACSVAVTPEHGMFLTRVQFSPGPRNKQLF